MHESRRSPAQVDTAPAETGEMGPQMPALARPHPPALQTRLLREFEPCLSAFDLSRLDEQRDTIFGLTSDGRLGYLNAAWYDFAFANDGHDTSRAWGVGAPWLSGIRGPLKAFYEKAFAHVADTRQVWEHDYQCPSPTTARRYRMRVIPLAPSGLLVVHALVVEEPLSGLEAEPHAYQGPMGLVVQCAACRRVRRPGAEPAWDLVPSLIARAPQGVTVSHGLCEPCIGHLYPP